MYIADFSLFFFFNDTATTEIYTLSLHDALPICGLLVAPRQVSTVVAQLGEWLAGPFFGGFAAGGPEALRGELDAAAQAADGAVAEGRDFLRDVYLPQTEGTPDAVGRDRYALAARRWTGSGQSGRAPGGGR